MDYFERCQGIVAAVEGGRNFDVINGKPVLKPKSRYDRGGPTVYGITWGTLSRACSMRLVAHNDITKLTVSEANVIYKALYWLPSRSDKMPWGLCLVHYDASVNCGVGGAAKQLQRTLADFEKRVSIDGVIGPLSLSAAAEISVDELINKYLDNRAEFYQGLAVKDASQGANLKGWLNRVERIRGEALKDE